jgi:hypothetical protein
MLRLQLLLLLLRDLRPTLHVLQRVLACLHKRELLLHLLQHLPLLYMQV